MSQWLGAWLLSKLSLWCQQVQLFEVALCAVQKLLDSFIRNPLRGRFTALRRHVERNDDHREFMTQISEQFYYIAVAFNCPHTPFRILNMWFYFFF